MTRRARRWDDPPRPQFNATSESSLAVKIWRDNEYKAGRPSGLLDYYRAHSVCITCKGCGLDPSSGAWNRDQPLFRPCNLCGGSGKVRVT